MKTREEGDGGVGPTESGAALVARRRAEGLAAAQRALGSKVRRRRALRAGLGMALCAGAGWLAWAALPTGVVVRGGGGGLAAVDLPGAGGAEGAMVARERAGGQVLTLTDVVETDARVRERFGAIPDAGGLVYTRMVDDAQLVRLLAEAGRDEGVVRTPRGVEVVAQR